MSTPALKKTTVAPLYAAGFTTAFGAHSIAAGLGSEFGSLGTSLLTLGILLAVYDLAEVILNRSSVRSATGSAPNQSSSVG